MRCTGLRGQSDACCEEPPCDETAGLGATTDLHYTDYTHYYTPPTKFTKTCPQHSQKHVSLGRPRSDSESRRKSANSDKNSAGKRPSDKRPSEGRRWTKKIGLYDVASTLPGQAQRPRGDRLVGSSGNVGSHRRGANVNLHHVSVNSVLRRSRLLRPLRNLGQVKVKKELKEKQENP